MRKLQPKGVTLDPEAYRQLQELASRQEVSVSALVRQAVRLLLSRQPEETGQAG